MSLAPIEQGPSGGRIPGVNHTVQPSGCQEPAIGRESQAVATDGRGTELAKPPLARGTVPEEDALAPGAGQGLAVRGEGQRYDPALVPLRAHPLQPGRHIPEGD